MKRNYERIPLDESTAKRIYILIADLKLTLIPSDEKIKGWDQGLDGYEYCFETATKDSYTFKTYWTAAYFAKDLQEAARIQTFADDLNIHLHINDLYNRIPPYHDGMVAVSVPTRFSEPDLRRMTGLYGRCSSAIVSASLLNIK